MENNHLRQKAGILVAVVFILGMILGGVGARYWELRVSGDRTGSRHAEIMKRLTHDLSLSEDQQTKVNAIVDDVHSKFRALDAEHRPEYDAIRAEGRQRICAVLTPEQQPKFDEFAHHLDEERKAREGMR